MAVVFATPIAHQTATDYPAYAGRLLRGRPFRQPLETPSDGAGFGPGLEVFIAADDALTGLYAWLDGELAWSADGTLTLTPDRASLYGRRSTYPILDMLEAPPALIAYDNVDRAAVQAALEARIAAAYADTVANPKRPDRWPRVITSVHALIEVADKRTKRPAKAAVTLTARSDRRSDGRRSPAPRSRTTPVRSPTHS